MKSEELTPPALPKTASLHNHNNNLVNVNNANFTPGAPTPRRDTGNVISPDSQSQNSGSPPSNNTSINLGDATVGGGFNLLIQKFGNHCVQRLNFNLYFSSCASATGES